MKWILRLVVIGVVGFIGLGVYQGYRSGYYSLPDLPDGAYPISFGNGLRGIVYDIEVSDQRYVDAPKIFRRLRNANKGRTYLGVPMDVAPWFEGVWSTCRGGHPEAQTYFEQSMPDDIKVRLQGARFEALCGIETDDGTGVIRGAIYSVPKF